MYASFISCTFLVYLNGGPERFSTKFHLQFKNTHLTCEPNQWNTKKKPNINRPGLYGLRGL